MPGCVSFEVVKLAKGYTNEEIWPSQVEKGDKIVDTIDDSAAVYIVRHKGQKDSTKATIPKIPENYSVFLANPRPAYYTLLLLSVPIDVATLPIQIICLPFTTLPVSH